MCKACPNCEKCGRTMPLKPKPSYWVGLLVAPLFIFIGGLWLHLTLGYWIYSFAMGWGLASTILLLKTDEHLSEVALWP